MAEIVLVHGIAQENRTADSLEEEWIVELAGSSRLAGGSDVADRLSLRHARDKPKIDVRMAFYADLFSRPGEMGALDQLSDLDPAQLQLAEEIALEWVEHAAERSSRLRDRDTARMELLELTSAGSGAMGSRSVIRSAINSAAKIRWFAQAGMGPAQLLKRSLRQVVRYFTDDALRAGIQDRVRSQIGPETRAIIAHSLGTVVAYEVVSQLVIPIPVLVTLGSPLGLRSIIYDRLRPSPAAFPVNIRYWLNLADRDDIIAANPNLRSLFEAGRPADSTFIGDATVDNGSTPHSGKFYLAQLQTGEAVNRAFADLP